MGLSRKSTYSRMLCATACIALASIPTQTLAAWEPETQVELIVAAGPTGSLDQMARLIQDIVVKHKLMKQELVVVNKPGGAGAESFLEIKGARGNPHKLLIASNNLLTTPIATGVPVTWKDMTPVAMVGFDSMMLWTQSSRYASAQRYIEAVKAAGPKKMKMGGTGAKQEDEMLMRSIEKYTGVKFRYVPFKGGDVVATQLTEGNIDSSLNRPAAAMAGWREGKLTPHCVFSEVRLSYTDKITATSSWRDIPTCKEAGIPVEYQSMRGIFMAAGTSPDQLAYYVDLIKKIMATPEWKASMRAWAFDQKFVAGKEFEDWLNKSERLHTWLMPMCDIGEGCM